MSPFKKLPYNLLFLIALFCADTVYAQLPVCSGPGSGMIYYLSSGGIYNLDPTQPISASNPTVNSIALPTGGAGGITVCSNINGPGPSPTFYITNGGNYLYYDGSNWVNTGHTGGSVNPGGGGGYIYNLIGGSGDVYKYDGTGNATLLTTISDFKSGGPFDLVSDCEGNFYILRLNTSDVGQYLRKYDPSGTLIQSWTISGAASGSSGGGFAIVGNTVYYHNTTGFWHGTISGGNINFTQFPYNLTPGPSDFGSCPLGSTTIINAYASEDTLYFCDTIEKKKIYADSLTQGSIASWSVISGNATIHGSGDTIEVSTSSAAVIVLSVTDTSSNIGCLNNGFDTVILYSVNAEIEAGEDLLIIGCTEFIDTIKAKLTNTTAGIPYNVKWQPQNKIQGSSTILTPVITPTGPTRYTVTISTSEEYGGCSWNDYIDVDIKKQLEARINITDSILCTGDTTTFSGATSLVDSSNMPADYFWMFGDNATGNGINVDHIYNEVGDYVIRLIVTDASGCPDTAYYELKNIIDPPYIFIGADTIICNGAEITLNKNNTAKGVDSYLWQDNSTEPQINIRNEGRYYVEVFNGCGMSADSIEIRLKDCSLWFPSGFTPNSDGLNDIAKIFSKNINDITGYELIIVNRFGEVVFQTNDVLQGWDGNYKGYPSTIGTYYYMIKYTINGVDEAQFIKGDLTLIR